MVRLAPCAKSKLLNIWVPDTALNSRAPVRIGDHVTATVKISGLIEHRKKAIFSCQCAVGEKPFSKGEAVVMIPSRTPKSKE